MPAVLLSTGTYNYTQLPGTFTVGNEIAYLESYDIDGDGEDEQLLSGGTFPPTTPVVAEAGVFLDLDINGDFVSFAGDVPLTIHPRDYGYGDFDGNGYMDVFIADHGYDTAPFPGNTNTLLLGSASGFTNASAGLPSLTDFSHSVSVGDIDDDGDLDLYIGNIGDDEAIESYFLLNDGSANFTLDRTRLPDTIANGVANGEVFTTSLLSDVTGDGHVDLIVGSDGNAGASYVFVNDGAGNFSDSDMRMLPLHPAADNEDDIYLEIQSTDVNGDGNPDLIVVSTDHDPFYTGWRLQVLINQGDGNFIDESNERLGTATHEDSGVWLLGVRLIDFNGDGTVDIVSRGSAPDGNDILVWLNDGVGYFAPLTSLDIANSDNLPGTDLSFFFTANFGSYADDTGSGFYQFYPTDPDTIAVAELDTVAPAAVQIRSFTGTPGNDVIDGDAGSDFLNAGAGNDTVDAGAGNDTIVGGDGAGNDFYDGGDDIDTLVYTSTTLGISVHLANGFATGTEIDVDTITNIENVITGSGQDAITGNDVANVLSGGDERDTIFGRGGNDTLNGDAGNDALFGQAGLDTLNGGTGNDVLFGGDDADILNGGDDNDVLRGEDGDDTLNGDAGDDTLLGEGGADALNGGDDVDTANYVLSPSAVTVSLLTGTGSGGFAEGDTLTGIERLRGSFHDDFLTGDNEDNLIQGLPGGDTISGAGGNDLVFGGPGDDTINGDAGVDALFGQAGADIINGGDERDVIFGGDEGDTLNGDDGNDVLLGEAGDDTLNGGEGHDSLLGGPGGDDLDGGNGFDLANYVLSSLGVNVSLATGTGSGGDAEGDTLTSIENLRGSNHADTLTGDDGSNQIRGLAGNDIIQGNGGVDVLFGNDGEDTLNGGSGTDFLNGGNDDDLYIIEDGTGIDHLIGFEAGAGSDDVADISDFSFADFNAVLSAAFDVGSDVHIQLDADDVLIIQNVLEVELHQDDFLI